MSYKIKTQQVFASTAISGTNTVTSTVSEIQHIDQIGFQLSTDSDAYGTITLQVSADYDPVLNSGTFVNLPVTYQFYDSVSIANGVLSADLMIANDVPFPYCRLSYTNTSGDGYLSATASLKGI